MNKLLLIAAMCLAIPVVNASTVLYQDRTINVAETLADPNDLWVPIADLTRVNGFELKPEGACLDDICVPVKRTSDSDLLVTRQGRDWFNVTELSRKIKQPFVTDHDQDVWSLGAIPAVRNRFVKQLKAPDFTLIDREGNPVSLSKYKDMKVLLLTWASW